MQIAHGLTAAHNKGITHRNLKPENVFVTTDGLVKILDFGLAKLTEAQPAMAGLSALPTAPPDTLPGMILGTVGYMAPEQVRGEAADYRADIFAFGAVLHEMLSGQRAFLGATTVDTITAILKEDPPDLPITERHIPPALVRIVDRCLEKNPAARFQATSDLAFALEGLSSQPERSEVSAGVAAIPTRRSHERLAWALFAVAFVAAVALGTMGYFRRTPVDATVSRTSILPPDGVNWSSVVPAIRFALSPDGRRLAFVGTGPDGRTLLWVRPLDALVTQPLAGTEDPAMPFWSPDSRFLAFNAGGKLKKIDVSGGLPVTLADGVTNNQGSWNPDDVILFVPGGSKHSLYRVSASGGTPTPATTLDTASDDIEHWTAFFLPDGRHFLYLALGSKTNSLEARAVYVGSLDPTEKPRLLLQGGSNAKYASGSVLFMRDTTLMAQPFDVKRLELTGEAVPVAERVQIGGASGRTGAFSVSQTGVLAYQAQTDVGSQPVWVDRTGKQIGVLGDPADYGDYGGIELSPDGTHVAVSLRDSATLTNDIWLFDAARGLRTRFTFDPANEISSIWSPDGSRLVFDSNRKGPGELYQKASSGAGNEDVLLADNVAKRPVSWSPDGRFILYVRFPGGSTVDHLWVLPLFGDRKPFPFLQTPFNETHGQFSPDGHWIAYQSSVSGRAEVYVAPFPGPGGKWQISTVGGRFPRWRRDGKELFYLAPDNRLMAATVNGQGSAFEVGAVRPLFQAGTRTAGDPAAYPYDVSAGGQRFLVNTFLDQAAQAPITIVQNWTAGLKR